MASTAGLGRTTARGKRGINLEMHGLDKMADALDKLDTQVGGRLVIKASKDAMEPVATHARRLAAKVERTGSLWKSIGIKKKHYRRNGVVWVGVGPLKSYFIHHPVFGLIHPVRYGHLVEYGFSHYKTGAFVRPRPWLRPALDGNRQRVGVIFRSKLGRGLTRAIKKARRAAGGPT